jgi:polysaccharide export outer membrane protein
MKMTQMKTYSRLFTALLFVSTLAVAQTQEKQTPMSMTAASITGGAGFGSGATVPIGAGDLLEMSVFDTPELSGKLRVSNKGEIYLPLVGSLRVDGMKAVEAQNLIRQKYIDGNYLKDPQVTLFISEYATQGVSVVGEVKSPGIYPAFGSHHLLDYLSVAQGLTPLAGTTIVITHAGHPDQPQSVKMTAGAAPMPLNNPEILSGDTIFVERTGLIYVVGDVMRPGGYPMDHDGQLTILQAVALAMGTSPTAAKGSAKLIRTTPQGREEIPINLKKIISAKATDALMQDNDILFVPSSVAKSAWASVQAALPAAAGASIYRVP